ncbi:MAG: hypothetical protein V4509_03505 [Patescibacteria group bacterium]
MSSQHKKIGLDFDDVIIDFCPALISEHNKEYGTSYEMKDMLHFEFEKLWGGTQKDTVDRIVKMYDAPPRINFSPVAGVVEALEILKDKYQFVVVTGRPDTSKNSVVMWLEKYIPGVFKEIYFTNQFHGEQKYTKADFCKMYNIDLFVDDYLPTILDITGKNISTILFDKPWNQAELPHDVVRVRSWKEIVDYLK